MHRKAFNEAAPKKTANLSINSDLLKQARALHINLAELLERQLIEILHQKEKWLAENRAAINEYNNRIERDGVFSDGMRRF